MDGIVIIKSYVEKNKKTFYKALPKEITPLIEKWKSVNPSEYVFPSSHGDKPIHPKTPNIRLARLSKRVLGKHVNPYLLRHSLATIKYNEDGADDDITANQLGHSKSMKNVYTHLDDDKLKTRAKKVWTNKKEMPKDERENFQQQIDEMKIQYEELKKRIDVSYISSTLKEAVGEIHGKPFDEVPTSDEERKVLVAKNAESSNGE